MYKIIYFYACICIKFYKKEIIVYQVHLHLFDKTKLTQVKI